MNISTGELGARITDARKRRGWTQAAAADALGLSRGTWIATEKGERRPTDPELVRIAEILHVELRQLLHPHVVLASAAPRFRSQRGAKRSEGLEHAIREAEDLARRYAELERLLGIPRTPAPMELVTRWTVGSRRLGADPGQAGAEAARMVRSALVVGEGPIHGLLGRLESMAGLRVFHLDLPPKVAAFQFWSEETGAVVVLHRGHPHERRRFSLAHETGHFLHDREAGDVLEADGPGRYDEHERFADAFAAELLLPEHGVKRNFHELVEGRAGAFTLAEVLAMADAWEVSFQAIMVRLEDLSLLPRGTFERVREAGFKPEVARRELGVTRQVARPQVVPERYRDLAIGAWENELISESELADHLHVDRLEARLIVESRQMVRLDDGSQVPADLGADILHAVGV